MENIELVIKIPEVDYVHFKELYESLPKDTIFVDTVAYYIGNGTPLPKGHGRLIDADKLLNSDGIIADNRKCHYIPMIDVYQAPTIIEANKE